AQAEPILRQLVARPDATPQMRQNLAMVESIQGNHADAEKLVRGDLPQSDAENNLTVLNQLSASNAAVDTQPLSAPPSETPTAAPAADASPAALATPASDDAVATDASATPATDATATAAPVMTMAPIADDPPSAPTALAAPTATSASAAPAATTTPAA